MLVQFKRWTCETEWGRYADGTIALKLVDVGEDSWGELVATATVCLHDPAPPEKLFDKKKQVWIKTWSENEGMYEALVAAGVIANIPNPVLWPTGFCDAKLADLTEGSLSELRAIGAPV